MSVHAIHGNRVSWLGGEKKFKTGHTQSAVLCAKFSYIFGSTVVLSLSQHFSCPMQLISSPMNYLYIILMTFSIIKKNQIFIFIIQLYLYSVCYSQDHIQAKLRFKAMSKSTFTINKYAQNISNHYEIEVEWGCLWIDGVRPGLWTGLRCRDWSKATANFIEPNLLAFHKRLKEKINRLWNIKLKISPDGGQKHTKTQSTQDEPNQNHSWRREIKDFNMEAVQDTVEFFNHSQQRKNKTGVNIEI